MRNPYNASNPLTGPWTCGNCGHNRNEATATTCSACGAARPTAPPKSEEEEEELWRCASCAYPKNVVSMNRCDMCKTERRRPMGNPPTREPAHNPPARLLRRDSQRLARSVGRIVRSHLLSKIHTGSAAIRDMRHLGSLSAASKMDDAFHEKTTWKVFATTFNVGNRRVRDEQMSHWLSQVDGCDIAAVALQEANYLSSSQKRGLTVLGAGMLVASTPFAVPVAALAAGATAAGAMALHSHLAPRIRRAVKHRQHHQDKKHTEDENDEEDNAALEDDDDDTDEDDSEYAKGHEGTPMLSLAIAAAIDRQMSPRGFTRAAFVEYGQLRLIVYNHSSVSVDKVQQAKHGIGNFFNKGGLAAKLTFSRRGTTSPSEAGKKKKKKPQKKESFEAAFLAVHLPAHEGQKESRNAALKEITEDEHVSGVMDSADATFLLGDLNYRLATPSATKKDSTTFESVCGLINASHFDALHSRDELIAELEGPTPFPALAGFATPSCDFPPTFKLHRLKLPPSGTNGASLKNGGGDDGIFLSDGTDKATTKRTYNDKRVPAWCDRVLFKARAAKIARIDLVHYRSHPNVTTSDHAPVSLLAAFVATPMAAPDLLSFVGSTSAKNDLVPGIADTLFARHRSRTPPTPTTAPDLPPRSRTPPPKPPRPLETLSQPESRPPPGHRPPPPPPPTSPLLDFSSLPTR